MVSTLQTAQLGETRSLIELRSHQQDIEAITQLFSQAQQHICIYSPTLQPLLYDTDPVLDALKNFALRSPRSLARILIHDTRTLTQHPHRMLELGHRLSSRIEFRRTHTDFSDRLDEFVLIDQVGFFKRPNAEHYAALCCFMDPQQTTELEKFFLQAWDHSEIDHELRSMLI